MVSTTLFSKRICVLSTAFVCYPESTPLADGFNQARGSDRLALPAFVFTGEGAQWTHMGESLLETFSLTLETIQWWY